MVRAGSFGILIATVIGLNAGLYEDCAKRTDSERPRTVRYYEGRPLETLIKRCDTALTVLSGRVAPPFILWPSSHAQYVHELVTKSEAIAVVEVVSITSSLTLTRDWITTDINMQVREILKRTEATNVEAGDQLTMKEDGGSVQLRGRTLTAKVTWIKPMAAGDHAVVFLDVEQGALVIRPLMVYPFDPEVDGRLLDRNTGALYKHLDYRELVKAVNEDQ